MCPAFRENLLEPSGFSELILVRQRAVSHAARRIPDAVGDEAAVFLEPAACVVRAIRRAKLSENGVAAVLGGGSMDCCTCCCSRQRSPASGWWWWIQWPSAVSWRWSWARCLVIFAHAPEGERADFEINTLFKRERRVLGTYSGGLKEQARVFVMLISGAFDPTPVVTHRLPLEQFDRGVAPTRTGQALKVLFTP